MWPEKGIVDFQICLRARVRLDIYSPFRRINMESSQCSLLAQSFHLVDVLISSIIPKLRVKKDVQNSDTYSTLTSRTFCTIEGIKLQNQFIGSNS
jgi:hypothetical protein